MAPSNNFARISDELIQKSPELTIVLYINPPSSKLGRGDVEWNAFFTSSNFSHSENYLNSFASEDNKILLEAFDPVYC